MTYEIYCATNSFNTKGYIGQTIEGLEERRKKHIRSAKSGRKDKVFAFQAAINKYGQEAFKWQVLETFDTLEEANEAEEFYIAYFNTLAPNGYNIMKGGDNRTVSQTTRKKISETLKITGSFVGKKGELHPNFGTTISSERKQHLSELFSGDGGANKTINSELARAIYIAYSNGMPTKKLKTIYGIGKGAIENIIHKRCWKDATKDLPDIDAKEIALHTLMARSDMTTNQVKELRAEYDNNSFNEAERISFLKKSAAKYGVKYTTVYNIVMRNTFSFITD